MTLTFRRALALLFGILFLVIAPLSVAYGKGYRFDTKTHHIRLTGVILLDGWPNHVRITIDDKASKSFVFPTTLQGLLPATHTMVIEATGYTSQVFTFNVRSGQTTFASDIQLYQTNPFAPLRTGIPKNAVLSPDGSAVAWLEEKNLTIADATSIKHVEVLTEAETLTWSDDGGNLLLQNNNHATLAIVSRTGIPRAKTYVLPTGDRPTIEQLLNKRMTFSTSQIIPGGAGWLLTDESSAWTLQLNGDLTLANRWGMPIVKAVHLGRNSIATIRLEEVLVRNLSNSQTALYAIPGITQASAGKLEGEINLLVADGDLLQWIRGNLF